MTRAPPRQLGSKQRWRVWANPTGFTRGTNMLLKLCWSVLALIHFVPALALVRPSLLTTLYAIDPQSPSYVLIWHRAALFAVLVVICLWASVRPEVRALASVAVAVSMVAFLILFAASGFPPSLRTIAFADLAGLPFLAFAAWRAFRPA